MVRLKRIERIENKDNGTCSSFLRSTLPNVSSYSLLLNSFTNRLSLLNEAAFSRSSRFKLFSSVEPLSTFGVITITRTCGY